MTGYGGADRSFFWGGGAPLPSEREINAEFRAGTLLNKAAVNQVAARDTIDAQVLTGMPYGRNASEPSKPTLEFPMMQLRVSNRPIEKEGSEFAKQLENLKDLLPEDVKRQLEKAMQEPLLGRDPSYTALNNALSYSAMALIWLSQMAKPFDPNGTPIRFANQNLVFIEQAMQHLMAQGERIIREGFLYLDSLGRGHIHYDALFNFLRQIALTIKLLKSTSSKRERGKDNNDESEEKEGEGKGSRERGAKDALERISRLTESLNKEYFHKKDDKEFQMIGALLKGIETLNRAYSLDPPLRSLLYGLITVHIGSDKSESELGFLGNEMKTLIDCFGEIIAKGFLYRTNSAEKVLAPFLISILTTICLTASAFLIRSDKEVDSKSEENPFIENTPELSIEEEEFIRICVLENFIRMASTMDLFSKVVDENKINPLLKQKGKELVSKSIELMLLVLVLKLLENYKKAFYVPMIEIFSDLLIERFKVFEEGLIVIKNEKNINLKIDHKSYVNIIHHLLGCRRSLEAQNYVDFDLALNNFFESLGASKDALNGEFKNFYDLAHTYRSVLGGDLDEFNDALTGIFHI